MTEELKQETVTEQEKPKAGRPPKDVSVRNLSARPITLIANRLPGGRITILPTESVDIPRKLFDELEKNVAAMSFFDDGQLVKA